MVKSSTGHHHKERVYTFLKKAITTQELRPGDKISERTLAKLLNVSRTPVREAIHALRDEGWLIVTPWQGSIVKPVTRHEVDEIMHLRMAIEPYTIRLVLPHLTPKDLDYLDSLIEKQHMIVDKDSASLFTEIDMEFHFHLLKASQNTKIIRIMQEISDLYLRVGVEVVQRKQSHVNTLAEHQKIVQALRANDSELAVLAMREHISFTMVALSKCLDITDEN